VPLPSFMGFMWVSCGFHVGFMGFMWVSWGFMWVSCGFHVGFLWVSHR